MKIESRVEMTSFLLSLFKTAETETEKKRKEKEKERKV